MSRLSEKVAIVTGASKGIGAGIATALAAAGARVAVNYSSDRGGAERAAQAMIENGSDAIAVGADVSKAADVARLFKEVDTVFGRLGVLVNNAGVFRFGAFAEITEESFHPEDFDLVILGGVTGSTIAAWTFAGEGKRVAVVELKYIGGSCPNMACLPSKNIIHSAKI